MRTQIGLFFCSIGACMSAISIVLLAYELIKNWHNPEFPILVVEGLAILSGVLFLFFYVGALIITEKSKQS
ncbi:hypothetical protein A2997_00110 [Candidatus Nomurabacteria bacterium RIFCSPLOWO2_01_FULL_36_10b]|uniref:Uncharacterized protein n=1 Tax=Candidatus Nomurabacteria bacterium RIFCSPLOWO2_01_FULL_36_10b TaxID=1801766 RepID=A0A1F6WNB4_9BACT|nr:MAG: hypothetical protein A2997_00110 [Candidatus Nomurabacteria bacterium RIFCSPLOWO2_01_FULL_36_10b]